MNAHPSSLRSRFSGPRTAPQPTLTPSPFPEDAHAVIYRPARSPISSGRARPREWKMRFERRSPPYIEPLMGWTGDDDTLTQVELSFPSAEAAIAYARRQGLQYTVHGLQEQAPELRRVSDDPDANNRSARNDRRRWRLEWVERTLGPDVIRDGFGPEDDPAPSYADPQDVLRDPSRSPVQKRDVLHRWVLDAYLMELALFKGGPQAAASRLQEVIDAPIDLDDPSLPARECAAFPPHEQQNAA